MACVLASTPAPRAQTCPTFQRTIAKLRKAKAGPTGLVSTDGAGLIKCDIAPAPVDRLATALPPIVAAAARQGFELEAGGDGACVASAEETIAFSAGETVRRVKHELTEKEKVEEEQWQRRVKAAAFVMNWHGLFVWARRFRTGTGTLSVQGRRHHSAPLDREPRFRLPVPRQWWCPGPARHVARRSSGGPSSRR